MLGFGSAVENEEREHGEKKDNKKSRFKKRKDRYSGFSRGGLEAKSVDGRTKSSVVCDAEQKSKFEFLGKTRRQVIDLVTPQQPLSAC